MKVLHITPHLGGGVGTVIMDWVEKVTQDQAHHVCSLDYINPKALARFKASNQGYTWGMKDINVVNVLSLQMKIEEADIVLVHYWDHPMLVELFTRTLPDCRMAFWCHKNCPVPMKEIRYPDRFITTSPIQMPLSGFDYIWSTGNMDRFLAIEPKPHEGFNIGYTGTIHHKKMHLHIKEMFVEIAHKIPNARFTFVGKNYQYQDWPEGIDPKRVKFVGQVDDVAPFLAEMDVFAYPLRPDHYGTCEIALGEAMCAGVVPVVMNNPAERLICGSGAIDEAEFCRTIEILHMLPKLRTELSPLIKGNARDRYSINNMIASWNLVFAEMMQNQKTKRSPL